MRRCSIILMSLLGLTGISTALADSYTRTLFAAQFVLVSNDLDDGYGNTISNMFPPTVTVYKLDASGRFFYQAQRSEALNPGEGAFVYSTSYAFLTFTGAQPPAQPPLTLEPGRFHLVSRRVGGLGASLYEDFVGSPPVEGSLVLRLSLPLQDYVTYSYHNVIGPSHSERHNWGPASPLLSCLSLHCLSRTTPQARRL